MSFALFEPTLPDRHEAAAVPAIARDISYADSAETEVSRFLIETLERLGGRAHLLRRAAGYETDLSEGADFWRVMADRFGIRLTVRQGALGAIPARGPLVVVANHPYGILDGLVLGQILSAARNRDFRLVAHSVFRKSSDLNKTILPIDFAQTRVAQLSNIKTRAEAINYLRNGGAVGIFPGGTVSTAATPFGRPLDPVWRAFAAKMIVQSEATVVPVWFDGHTSRLFQVCSHLSYTLRMGLLMREFRKRVDTPVSLAIGAPIPFSQLRQNASDAKQTMDFIRRKTYELSPDTLDPMQLGHEFEESYRR